MAGPSIAHWKWFRQPDVELREGVIYQGEQQIPYYPGENRIELLNAIKQIVDEKTAIHYVRNWGFLGINQVANVWDKRSSALDAASNMFRYLKERYGETVCLYEAWEAAAEMLGMEYSYIVSGKKEVGNYSLVKIMPPGETISEIMKFAEWVRHISMVKNLLNTYEEDPYVADNEAEEWLESLSQEHFKGFIQPYSLAGSLEYFSKIYKELQCKGGFYQFVLVNILHFARLQFSDITVRSSWLQIFTAPINDTEEKLRLVAPITTSLNSFNVGFPVLMFDTLLNFIKYELLVEPGSWPERCKDPKCQQLFFPNRKGQRYCPPPPSKKRSLCEQRHGKELRRL